MSEQLLCIWAEPDASSAAALSPASAAQRLPAPIPLGYRYVDAATHTSLDVSSAPASPRHSGTNPSDRSSEGARDQSAASSQNSLFSLDRSDSPTSPTSPRSLTSPREGEGAVWTPEEEKRWDQSHFASLRVGRMLDEGASSQVWERPHLFSNV